MLIYISIFAKGCTTALENDTGKKKKDKEEVRFRVSKGLAEASGALVSPASESRALKD